MCWMYEFYGLCEAPVVIFKSIGVIQMLQKSSFATLVPYGTLMVNK